MTSFKSQFSLFIFPGLLLVQVQQVQLNLSIFEIATFEPVDFEKFACALRFYGSLNLSIQNPNDSPDSLVKFQGFQILGCEFGEWVLLLFQKKVTCTSCSGSLNLILNTKKLKGL